MPQCKEKIEFGPHTLYCMRNADEKHYCSVSLAAVQCMLYEISEEHKKQLTELRSKITALEARIAFLELGNRYK